MVTASVFPSAGLSMIFRFEKSTPPVSQPIGGMMISVTREVTILPKAVPIMIPTAISTTFPLMAKSLNSLSIYVWFFVCLYSI